MRKPEKKIIPVWVLFFILASAVVSLIASVLASNYMNYSFQRVFTVVFTLLSAFSVVFSYARYRAWRYTLRDDHMYLEHGVFIKIRTMVPYVRVQHIDTQKTIVDRITGLSRLVVYTAGSRGADVTIPGLLPEEAEEMQEKLRDLAIESEDRDGV